MDLTEVLKDCPVGTKFYSSYLGKDVFFIGIHNNYIECEYLPQIDSPFKSMIQFRKEGSLYKGGECMLFPSKDQRDWSKWQRPFVDGDIIFRKQIIEGFKFHNIGIYKSLSTTAVTNDMTLYCQLNADSKLYKHEHEVAYADAWRLATEEEKQKLFDAIKANGYKWNAETKILEKLKKEKFDPKTLKPFESRVLVSTLGKWVPAIFGHCNKEQAFPIIVVGGNIYTKCIPYEGNEHLINTYDQPSEFYRYWEE